MNPITGLPDPRSAYKLLESCELCPRRCRVNRLKGQKGFCKSALRPVVYSFFLHPGEEPPISGQKGSGTIFFTHCTMHCVYCQNFEFSQLSDEKEISTEELAGIMLALQEKGAHNINLVTPTHFIPQILEALFFASQKGFNLPVVYNTGGYELVSTLKLLEGVVDIYLADMRYGEEKIAERFSNARNYVKINREAIAEMFRQAGNLVMDQMGIAKKGLIVRHLVLPNNMASSESVFKFLSETISKDVFVSLMSQYHPVYRAGEFDKINRKITSKEYENCFNLLLKYGLLNGWAQNAGGSMNSALLGTNIKKI
ncbi:MAG: radical SAM protein [Candidatus Omnitrophica bacterium]|nr:radical SAM protein [Candidatus Omnitrophota bacterium]